MMFSAKFKTVLRKLFYVLLLLVILLLARQALLAWAGREAAGEYQAPGARAQSIDDPQQLRARGAYLLTRANCLSCHTSRGAPAFSGGPPLNSRFGVFYAPNLTPDPGTGLGNWNAEDFWRALHHGKGRDGRMLYPAFPYPNYTLIPRADSDAMFAYLRSLAPVVRARREHQLDFPYASQTGLALWRVLYFRAGNATSLQAAGIVADPVLQRGAYLAAGPGHCSACHAERNAMGAAAIFDFSGGVMQGLRGNPSWSAPNLHLQGRWRAAELQDFLAGGVSERHAAFGPMAEVVAASTQHWQEQDLRDLSSYLLSLPPLSAGYSALAEEGAGKPQVVGAQHEAMLAEGAQLYRQHCLDCHGTDKRGQTGVYPDLLAASSLQLPQAYNAIRITLHGGFAPATTRNPRPYSMNAFGAYLSDAQIAAVLSYLRCRPPLVDSVRGQCLVSPAQVGQGRALDN